MIFSRLPNHPAFGIRRPYSQLERVLRDFDRFLEGWPNVTHRSLSSGVFPPINLSEDGNKFIIRTELPGVTADELDLQATGKSVSISGERKISSENDGVKYHRREREAGQFSRMIGMPSEIDPDKIEANLKNGILTVIVPKTEAAKPRQIKVS
jgi:HSP20 family protein